MFPQLEGKLKTKGLLDEIVVEGETPILIMFPPIDLCLISALEFS